MTAALAPVLRYPGGKARLAPWIVDHLPPHDVYIEPFFGGGSVLFAKDRCLVELVNDLDDRVTTFFRVLRDRPDELIRAVELTPYARAEYELSTEPVDEELEAARRFLVRVWMAHGGKIGHRSGWRNGWSGGDTPNRGSSARVWVRLPDRLRSAVDRLSGVMIDRRPALQVIGEWAKPGAVIYADPPYLDDAATSWTGPYQHTMTDADHVELLDALDRHPGPVLLSGYRSALYDDRLQHWRRVDREVRAYRQAKRTECLWLNPVAAAAAKQLPMFGGEA